MNSGINFSDVVIWVQAESTQSNDIVIKDRENLSLENNNYITISTFAVRIEPYYERIGISDKLQLYKIPNTGYLIMSNLQETDVVSRKRAFSAVIKRHSIDDCWKVLNQTLNQMNLHCQSDDYSKMVNMLQKHDKKDCVFIISMGLAILSILTLFVKLSK